MVLPAPYAALCTIGRMMRYAEERGAAAGTF
jgi:hypothetical protein